MNRDFVRLTMGYVIALILLGLIGFFATGAQSVTALIPAFFGVIVFIVLQIFKGSKRPTVGLAILFALALLGFVATVAGVPKTVAMIQGDVLERPAAAISQAIMALLSLLYGVACLLFIKRTGRNGNPME